MTGMELKDLVNLEIEVKRGRGEKGKRGRGEEEKRGRGEENKKIKETFYNKAAKYYL